MEINNTEVAIIEEEKQLVVAKEIINLDKMMEMATMLSKSTIVPVAYMNRPENCFIALDMSSRMGISPMVVMQNLFVIQGKPSWAGQAIGGMIRTNPSFKNVDLVYVGEEGRDSWGAYVTAEKVSTGQKVKGGTVTIAIAKKEGWYTKTGSKWQTMPELMLAYRAYAWFGRVYCPELMMGLQTTEEVYDVTPVVPADTKVVNPYEGK